jgi:hypothetical protein
MSINRLQRPQLVVVGNGMAGMRTVEELHWLREIDDQPSGDWRTTSIAIRQDTLACRARAVQASQ